jgi:alkylhydroperoxidase/carboxymuconolactone decarboxylase family protein YurZ
MSEMTDREARAEETYARLFGPRDTSAADNDPEFGRILQTFIFGDVFATGDLNDPTRELITVTVLATLNTLPQLKAHTRAALQVGVTPVELREAVYQLAPFIGFPRDPQRRRRPQRGLRRPRHPAAPAPADDDDRHRPVRARPRHQSAPVWHRDRRRTRQ